MSPLPSRRQRLPFAPSDRCWSCDDPIDAFQAAGQGGVCARFACRAAEVRRRQAEDRRVEARRRDLARARLADEGVDPETTGWSVTPSNDAELVPLTAERRTSFLDYLGRITREAVEEEGSPSAGPGPVPDEPLVQIEDPETRDAVDDPREDGRFGPPGPAEADALAAGCATCRGWCCRQGGTHAFLKAGRIRRLLRERPGLEPGDVTGLYRTYLDETHLEGGCVFQGETGCRLPRELRSDTCNEYLCPDLVHARRRWRRSGPGREHRFVAVSPGRPRAERIGEVPTPDCS